MSRTLAESNLDQEVLYMAGFFFKGGNYKMATTKVKRDLLGGIGQKMYMQKMARLAMALVLVQQKQRVALERTLCLALPRPCLLAYTDISAYDETPMRSTLLESSKHVPGQKSTRNDGAWKQLLAQKFKHHGIVAKLLQMKTGFSILLKLGSSYGQIQGTIYPPLQALENTTGQVVQQAILNNTAMAAEVDSFQFCCRQVCADKAASNAKAEAGIQASRGAHWGKLVVPCSVHRTSTCMVKTFEPLVAEDIVGLIHAALALGSGIGMTLFRTCLQEEIEERGVEVRPGCLTPLALKYKRGVLELFGEGQKHNLALPEKVLLMQSWSGDWRDTKKLHIYAGNAVLDEATPEQRANILTKTLLAITCNRQPCVWPRHRWTGSENVVNQFGLLQCLHGLFRPAMQRWLRSRMHWKLLAKPKGVSENLVALTDADETACVGDIDASNPAE
eukprot:5672525-Amphidinium_carterae.1